MRAVFWIIIVIVVVVAIAALGYPMYKCRRGEFNGLWNANQAFLDVSDLSTMQLYLDVNRLSSNLTGTLIMNNKAGESISGQKITIKGLPMFMPNAKYPAMDVVIVYEKNKVMPDNLKMDIDFDGKTIKLYDGTKTYAQLTRT